jgi:hypothetical protein
METNILIIFPLQGNQIDNLGVLFSTIMQSAIIKTVHVLDTLRLKNGSDNLYKLTLKNRINHKNQCWEKACRPFIIVENEIPMINIPCRGIIIESGVFYNVSPTGKPDRISEVLFSTIMQALQSCMKLEIIYYNAFINLVTMKI